MKDVRSKLLFYIKIFLFAEKSVPSSVSCLAPLSDISWLYLCGPLSGLHSPSLVYGVFSLVGLCGGSVVKNLPADAGDIRDTSSIPASGGSPGEGNGTPF